MLIKAFPTGRGAGFGPTEYLCALNPFGRGKRAVPPKVLKGDPSMMRRQIDAVPFDWKYTSGVASFALADAPTEAQLAEFMDDFEKLAFAGLPLSSRSILWVLHEENNRKELHFVIPRQEVHSGKSFNAFPPGWEKKYDLLRDSFNYRYGWARPDDPIRARPVQPGWEALAKADAKRRGKTPAVTVRDAVTEKLMALIGQGHIHSRADIMQALRDMGYELPRAGKDYLTISDPATKKHTRLKGTLYNEEFSRDAWLVQQAMKAQLIDKPDMGKAMQAAAALQITIEKTAAYNKKRYTMASKAIDASQAPCEHAKLAKYGGLTPAKRGDNSTVPALEIASPAYPPLIPAESATLVEAPQKPLYAPLTPAENGDNGTVPVGMTAKPFHSLLVPADNTTVNAAVKESNVPKYSPLIPAESGASTDAPCIKQEKSPYPPLIPAEGYTPVRTNAASEPATRVTAKQHANNHGQALCNSFGLLKKMYDHMAVGRDLATERTLIELINSVGLSPKQKHSFDTAQEALMFGVAAVKSYLSSGDVSIDERNAAKHCIKSVIAEYGKGMPLQKLKKSQDGATIKQSLFHAHRLNILQETPHVDPEYLLVMIAQRLRVTKHIRKDVEIILMASGCTLEDARRAIAIAYSSGDNGDGFYKENREHQSSEWLYIERKHTNLTPLYVSFCMMSNSSSSMHYLTDKGELFDIYYTLDDKTEKERKSLSQFLHRSPVSVIPCILPFPGVCIRKKETEASCATKNNHRILYMK